MTATAHSRAPQAGTDSLPVTAYAIASENRPRGLVRRQLASIGSGTRNALLRLTQSASLGFAVILHCLRPRIWSRTIRTELMRAGYRIGVQALPSILGAALLVGLALVMQTLYWLDLAGQVGFMGRFLVLGLIRETGPVLVALIVVGRSGTVTIMELARIRRGRQLHMLSALGIDPFRFLVLPRVIGFAISGFSLTVIFLSMALMAGYFAANASGVADMTFTDFVNAILSAMGPAEYAVVMLKSLSIGFAIGVICCITALGNTEASVGIAQLVSRGFMRSVLAAFVISGFWSLVL